MPDYEIDNLDRAILNALSKDARQPYAQLAKEFDVSPATIHVRVEKLKAAGIITGTHVQIDPKALGYDVCCFIGVTLKAAGDYPDVLEQLKAIDEVVEAHYTTGQYSVFIKIMARSIEDLQWILIDKIQAIDKVQSTETLIALQSPINRAVKI